MLGEGSAALCSSCVGAFPAEQPGDNGPATRDPSQDPSLALPQQENRSFTEQVPAWSERSEHSYTNQAAPEFGSLSFRAGETLCPILVLGAEEAPVCTLS